MNKSNSKAILKPKKFPFVMVGQALFDYTTDSNAIKLYLGLLTWADNNTGRCYPNFTQIQERINMSKNTISKAVKILERAGLLEVQKGRKKGNLKPNNIYIVETELTPKKPNNPIANFGIEKENPIAKNGIEPIANFDIPLSQNLGHNYTHLTKLNIELERGEKSPHSNQITQSELLPIVKEKPKKKTFEERKQVFIDRVNTFEKYSASMRLNFIEWFTQVDDDDSGSQVMTFESIKKKKGVFSTGGRLATWKKNEKPTFKSGYQAKADKDAEIMRATANMNFEEKMQWKLDNGLIDPEVMKGWQ
jgi:DNA-binding transcriptional ArsR family regulator